MARTTRTHELISFSIQDWRQGQRWGDAFGGDVKMDWTRLPSGGKRPWFLCPSCGRRCGVLYSIGSRIICRKCGGLSYESQNEQRQIRGLRKAQKICVRLGGSANMTEPFPGRRTYQRLRHRYEAAVEQYVGSLWLQLRKGSPDSIPTATRPKSTPGISTACRGVEWMPDSQAETP